MGQYRFLAEHLIGQHLAQHMEIEHISRLKHFQIRKHLLGRQTGMAGDDGMGADSSYRQRTAQQMPDAPVQGA